MKKISPKSTAKKAMRKKVFFEWRLRERRSFWA